MLGSSTTGFPSLALSLAQVIPVFFFLVFFVWVIYTIVAAFHWFHYGNNTTTALCALSAHLIVSAWIAIYAVSGLMS